MPGNGAGANGAPGGVPSGTSGPASTPSPERHRDVEVADLADRLENERETTGDRGHAEHEFDSEDAGYHKSLKPRQIQMIAIGGAIGTGLFLGAGGRLHDAGPALAIVYLVCGFFAFLILRALGELVLHRPSSGSFVSYAREFFGEKVAYGAGWLYFLNWATTAIVDVTAVALYVQFWKIYLPWLADFPTWITSLVALALVLGLNLVSVKVFGEMEFWFALIKVTALIAFLVVGIVFLIFVGKTDVGPTGISVISENGGFFPLGAIPGVLAITGVVFAYAAIELVGTAAGETKEPAKVMPKAVNTVIVRIAIFYVGSVLLLSFLLPYTQYGANESPFVTFFSHVGGKELSNTIASIMNFVVLTAALSSLNAGLYSTGRILRSMSANGSAPKFTGVMNKAGVPYGGILLTAGIALLGIGLNAWLGASEAFKVVLDVAALGIIGGWATIMICQIQLQRWSKQGKATRPHFRLFGAPFTAYLTLAFLAFVLVSEAFSESGRWVLASLVVLIPLLILGWFLQRKRILEAARIREGYTGAFSVRAERPNFDATRDKR